VIRAAFFGTPAEAVPVLGGLRSVAEVALVVTQPDRPRGRSGTPLPPPVKVAALQWGLRVVQPARHAEVVDALAAMDVAVVAAYGRLIPAALLGAPRRGFLNVHFSLLPRWRGASPVVRTILAGDDETGVTLMEMDEGLDTGGIIVSARTPVHVAETAGELTARLADRGAELLSAHLGEWVDGKRTAAPQDDRRATAAAKVSRSEALVLPAAHGAVAVFRAVRAFNPRPGAWGVVEGQTCKLWRVAPADGKGAGPGIASVVDGRVVLGCADGAVELLSIQPAGRSAMSAIAWMNGRRGEPARFEAPGSR